MPYKKVIAYLQGTIQSSNRFRDIEVDVCNEVLEFFGHDDFVVEYDIDVYKTLDGRIKWYEVTYRAWERGYPR